MTKKWIVEGRVRADINFEYTVEAPTEKAAVKQAERMIYAKAGITVNDVLDDEIYCERVKDWGTK